MKPMSTFSKVWPGLSLAVIALLAFLLIRGCYNPPSHGGDKKTVDSSEVAYLAYKLSAEARIKQLQADSIVKDRRIDTLVAERMDDETDLDNRGKIIGNTLNNYHNAVVIHDTPRIFNACDSLATEVEAGKIAVHGYRVLTDSLVAAYVDQGKIKDSMSQAWHSLFLHADTANAIARQKYASLYVDYVKQGSKLKLNQITTKLGVISVAILGGILLLKH